MEGELRPQGLRCEGRTDPLGIGVAEPRLTWRLPAARRGLQESGHQIVVASRPELLESGRADLWDSGRVDTVGSVPAFEPDGVGATIYGGAAVTSRQQAWWRVRAWDEAGSPTEWSEPATWEMALLSPADWSGRWISAPQQAEPVEGSLPVAYLRRAFDLPIAARRARLYVTALGLHRPHLNGDRIDRDELRPGWTDYTRRLQHQVIDVTDRLVVGENVLGLLLGEGWYAGYVGYRGGRSTYGSLPEARAQLEVELEDGSTVTIGTDEQWLAGDGAVRTSDLLKGETYDAGRDQPGWDRPVFAPAPGRDWLPARPATGLGAGVALAAEASPPVRATLMVEPVETTSPAPGVALIDLGQNIHGRVRVQLHGPAGSTVTIRHGEILDADGALYTENLRGANAVDTVTIAEGPLDYEPTFTTHGFRYVELAGDADVVAGARVIGVVLHQDLAITGAFASSSPDLNQLWSNIVWGQRGNFVEVPTDCPQRDERLGWMADAQVFLPTACLIMDCEAFLAKWIVDIRDAQHDDGGFTDVVPRVPEHSSCSPGWADAGVLVPWISYTSYGDRRTLADHLEAMTRWVDLIERENPTLLWTERVGAQYGDWLSIEADTPAEVVATAYFFHTTATVAAAARAAGDADRAERYATLAARIRDAFRATFVEERGHVTGRTQTSYVLALRFGLLEPDEVPLAAANLVADIEARGDHLSTGFLGTPLLLPALTDVGRVDVAHRLLAQDTLPSWLYQVRMGATTMWERWDGVQADGTFQRAGMNSFNHYAFGAVGEWMVATLAGLAQAPGSVGWREVSIAPHPGGALTFAEAIFDGPRGRLASRWEHLDGGGLRLDVEIPASTRGRVRIPAAAGATVTEGGQPLNNADGVVVADRSDDAVVVEVGSGRYSFGVG